MSTKGSTLLSSPIPTNAAQTRLCTGIRCPSKRSTINRVAAAQATYRQRFALASGRFAIMGSPADLFKIVRLAVFQIMLAFGIDFEGEF
jgi:hypothetical protein